MKVVLLYKLICVMAATIMAQNGAESEGSPEEAEESSEEELDQPGCGVFCVIPLRLDARFPSNDSSTESVWRILDDDGISAEDVTNGSTSVNITITNNESQIITENATNMVHNPVLTTDFRIISDAAPPPDFRMVSDKQVENSTTASAIANTGITTPKFRLISDINITNSTAPSITQVQIADVKSVTSANKTANYPTRNSKSGLFRDRQFENVPDEVATNRTTRKPKYHNSWNTTQHPKFRFIWNKIPKNITTHANVAITTPTPMAYWTFPSYWYNRKYSYT